MFPNVLSPSQAKENRQEHTYRLWHQRPAPEDLETGSKTHATDGQGITLPCAFLITNVSSWSFQLAACAQPTQGPGNGADEP